MKKYFRFLITLLLGMNLGIAASHAQERPEDVTEHFFQLFETKGPDEAVDYVFNTNKWLNAEKTTSDAIKAQLKKGIAIIGQYYGYELIEKQSLGNSFVMMSYMVRYDRQPIKFLFMLYKPNDKWQIQNLKFEDRLDDDFVKP